MRSGWLVLLISIAAPGCSSFGTWPVHTHGEWMVIQQPHSFVDASSPTALPFNGRRPARRLIMFPFSSAPLVSDVDFNALKAVVLVGVFCLFLMALLGRKPYHIVEFPKDVETETDSPSEVDRPASDESRGVSRDHE